MPAIAHRTALMLARSRQPLTLAALALAVFALGSALPPGGGMPPAAAQTAATERASETQSAIFAGGCFWCVEKDFDHIAGVLSTTSGYIGGRFPNPTYESHGSSGDLEAVEVVFDPAVVSYEQLAFSFLRSIDVTDDNGQFCDRGNSYRSAFFVLDADQRASAEAAVAEGSAQINRSIRTRVLDAPTFWPAEDYHQDYYLKNPLRYQFYRTSCGRDRQVERVWGEAAYAGIDRS
jgi:peptide-methionine (S)-S-oxide reductase